MVLIGKGRLGENDRLQGGASILTLHEYYTNYDIHNKNKDYEVISTRSSSIVGPKVMEVLAPTWWKFKTNLDPDDFSFGMSEAAIKSFLNKMWEIYRHRKAD